MRIADLDNRLTQMANELDLLTIDLPDSDLKLAVKDAQIAVLMASVELAKQVRAMLIYNALKETNSDNNA